MSLFEGREIIDISPLVHSKTAVFPGDKEFELKEAMSFDFGDHLSLSSINTTVHIGAHADAPIHYHPKGTDISKRDLGRYLGSVEVVEVSVKPGQRIFPKDFERKHLEAKRVLFKTNSFPNPDEWVDNFNSLSPETVQTLAKQGCVLVGIDTPSVDPHDSKDLESHNEIYKCDLAVLEGVVLSAVEPGIYELVALPLKIAGGDASPVRAVLVR